MFKKAMELYENCGVTVTLVTENQGVFHFYNTSHKPMKQVFQEFLHVLDESPDQFSCKIPSSPTREEHDDDSDDIVVSNSQLQDFQMGEFSNVADADLVEALDMLPDLESDHNPVGGCELGDKEAQMVVNLSTTTDVSAAISDATNSLAPTTSVNYNAIANVATAATSVAVTVGAEVIVNANENTVAAKDMSKEARQARKAARLVVRNEAIRVEAKREARKVERKISRLTSNNSSSPAVVSIQKKAKPSSSATVAVAEIAPVAVVKPALASSTTDAQESLAKKQKRTVNSEFGTILTVMTKATTPARLKNVTNQMAQQLNQRVNAGAVGKRKICDTDIEHVKVVKVSPSSKHVNPFQAPIHPSIVERPRVISPAEEEIGNWLDRVTTTLSASHNQKVVEHDDPLFAQFAQF